MKPAREPNITNWLRQFLIATVLLMPVPVQAQQPAKITRIGYLAAASFSVNAARVQAFRRGLRNLGYVEGKNIFIEWRSAEGKLDRLPALAAELVRLNVDIIVTGGQSVTRPAAEVTSTIPIVMTQDSDPVANGFVASLARPGGNITGLSTLVPELSGKKLELMKEIISKLSRVAVFGSSSSPSNAQSLREVDLAARAFKVQLQHLDVVNPSDIETAFRAASNGRAEGVLVLNSPVFVSHRTQIVDLAVKSRLPAIYSQSDFAEDGGLMTYGTSLTDLNERAAAYVDKILKGAKPADLPIEQPKKFELIVNLKAAKQIGVTIPPNVLARADKVIRLSLFRIADFEFQDEKNEHDTNSERSLFRSGLKIRNAKLQIRNSAFHFAVCS
jgi:putative ABC transport system substrate-binding protein